MSLLSRRRLIGLGSTVAVAVLAAGCSPLAVFDAVLPADDGGRLVASDLDYAPGDRRRLDIYAPAAAAGDRLRPVVFFTHGGSWSSGGKDEYGFLGRAFAAAGFVTVVYNYRLVPEVVFPGFVEDGALALAFARKTVERYGGDPDRIVLAGHSAGAYNAAMLALDPQFLRRAGVPRRVIRGAALLAGPYDFLPLEVDATKAAFGAVEDLRATQPVEFVTAGAPPFFLAAGTEDETVKPKNTRALAERLRAAGVPVVERSYDGVDHAGILLRIARPLRDRTPVYRDMVAFIARVAGRG